MNTETPKHACDVVTVQDLIKTFDSGGSVFSIECGGLGPGYELALQLAAIHFAKEHVKEPFVTTGDETKDWCKWMDKCTESLHSVNEKLLGLSGAQFNAAAWLAWEWCLNGGPAALIERARKDGKEDRIVQISNRMPTL